MHFHSLVSTPGLSAGAFAESKPTGIAINSAMQRAWNMEFTLRNYRMNALPDG